MRPGTEMFLNADESLTDAADITLSGRLFQMVGPATGKARPPTVDSFADGTSRRLARAERRERRPGKLPPPPWSRTREFGSRVLRPRCDYHIPQSRLSDRPEVLYNFRKRHHNKTLIHETVVDLNDRDFLVRNLYITKLIN